MYGTCFAQVLRLRKKNDCADYEKCLTCGRRTRERVVQVIVAGIKWLQECEAGTVNTKVISTILRASAITQLYTFVFFPPSSFDASLWFYTPYISK